MKSAEIENKTFRCLKVCLCLSNIRAEGAGAGGNKHSAEWGDLWHNALLQKRQYAVPSLSLLVFNTAGLVHENRFT